MHGNRIKHSGLRKRIAATELGSIAKTRLSKSSCDGLRKRPWWSWKNSVLPRAWAGQLKQLLETKTNQWMLPSVWPSFGADDLVIQNVHAKKLGGWPADLATLVAPSFVLCWSCSINKPKASSSTDRTRGAYQVSGWVSRFKSCDGGMVISASDEQ